MAKKTFITNKTKRNINYPCGISLMYVKPKIEKGNLVFLETEIPDVKLKAFNEDHKKMQKNGVYKKFVDDKLIVIEEKEIKKDIKKDINLGL